MIKELINKAANSPMGLRVAAGVAALGLSSCAEMGAGYGVLSGDYGGLSMPLAPAMAYNNGQNWSGGQQRLAPETLNLMMAQALKNGKATGDYSEYNKLALQKPRVTAEYKAEERAYRQASGGGGFGGGGSYGGGGGFGGGGGYGARQILPGLGGLGFGNSYSGNTGAGLAPLLGIAAPYMKGFTNQAQSNLRSNGRVRANELIPRKYYKPPPRRR